MLNGAFDELFGMSYSDELFGLDNWEDLEVSLNNNLIDVGVNDMRMFGIASLCGVIGMQCLGGQKP